jgi:hypothetical protein
MRSIPLRMVPFDAAIVIRRTAKANGPRARETAMLYDHGSTGQRDVLVVSDSDCTSSNAHIAAQNCTSRQGADVSPLLRTPTGPHIAAFILP